MDIQSKYPYFESNQVLTHSQLNDLFNYLDQQNRLTRSKLIGIGIVCGLDVEAPSENAEGVPYSIQITEGIGITSEGYLFAYPGLLATHRRKYDLTNSVYKPFEIDTNPDDFLFELIHIKDDETAKEGEVELIDNFLKDKVVIAFLDLYIEDLRSCLVRSCDEIGQTCNIDTRIFVTSRENAEKIRQETGLIPSTEDIFLERFDLPVISIERMKLTPEDFDSPGDIYSIVLNKYRLAVSNIREKLIDAIKLTYTSYQPILLPLYTENPFEFSDEEDFFKKWEDYIKVKELHQDYFGMQYFYDFIKDLILAYDEFRIAAFDIVRKCNIDMSLFPRHLFLGEAYPTNDELENNPEDNRNDFTQPFIYKNLQANIEKAKTLHQRLVQMITSFELDFISIPENRLSLRITPSNEKGSSLSERAIPFYYNIADSESELLKNWNYELTRRNQANQNLSFHASDYSAPDHVISPLDFNYDKYPFLRIEGNSVSDSDGVLRTAPDIVLTELQNLKKDNNLPFDIKLFNLTETPEDIEISDVNSWKDLQTEYISLRDSLICELQKLVKNLKTPEDNEFRTQFDDLDTQITDLYPEILEAIPYNLNSFEFETFSERVNRLFDKLTEYNLYIKYLFGKILHESYHIITPQEFHEQTQILNDTFHLIRHFMSNCILYRLITLYCRFQYRMEYLQENSLELFPNFLKEHPGIEHEAGVSKGGTYIMLHDEVTVTAGNENRIIADFALPYICCSQNQQIPSPEDEPDNLNLPPVAVADYYDVIIGVSEVPLDILNNDLIRDANNLEISTESVSASGRTVEQRDGVIWYSPPDELSDTDYLIDSFNYTIKQTKEDNEDKEDSALVKVLVRPPYKLRPKAVDDVEFTNIDTEIQIDVLKNDYYNDDTVIELLLLSPNSTLGAALAIETNNDTGVEKQLIRYTPLVTGRDSFKYSINYPTSELEPSIGEVRVFVGSTSSFAAILETVQKNSVNNQITVLNSDEESLPGIQLTLLDAEGNPGINDRTEHGIANVAADDLLFNYSPDSEYFGADVLYYQVSAEDAYSRIDSVNILVMCCCINIPDYEKEVIANEEYKLDLSLFAEKYPNLQFLSIGIIDRDIVEASIQDDTQLLHFVPTNDIVFVGQYIIEYFATDNNKNCYKGKIILTPDTFEVELPDINVHLTTLDTAIIEIPIAEKYGWSIKEFEQLAETLGELTIINVPVNNAFQYIPAGGIENVHTVSFNYTLVNSAGKSLDGKVNLINLISNHSLPYIPEIVQKNSVNNQLNVLKKDELEFESYKLLIIDSEDNAVTEAETPHGKVIVHDNEGEKIILYTPNASYFGTDIFEYQIIAKEGYYRRGTVNLFVICCCIDLTEYKEKVTPGKEYKIDIDNFSKIYPGIWFKSLGQFNRDIVNVGIIEDSITFIPGDDIVYAGEYSFEFFASDDNENCYKGKIILTPDTFDVELPDINVHITTLNPISIPVEVAEKYQWKIEKFVPLNKSYGVLLKENDSTFSYKPAAGIENVLMVNFNYTLKNQDSNILNGKVNLINMISKFVQSYIPFRQINKLIPKVFNSSDQIGYSVDIYGQFAIIGARGREVRETVNNGTAYIFKKNPSGQWSQYFELINEDLQSNNYFGHSVAINNIPEADYYALVGAYGNNAAGAYVGAVYSFRLNSQLGRWDSHAIIQANDAEASDYFGNAIDINNNIAVIGAYAKDIGVANTGCAYIFELKNEKWVQLQRLQASDAEANDYFGYSVSIHGSTIVVGAYAEDSAVTNSGSCYVFEREGDEWIEVQKIQPEFPETSEHFGFSSAIYGDWVVVGSYLKDVGGTNAGNASVYHRDSANKSNWKLFQTLQADDLEQDDRFGISVVIDNETIIVGSYLEDTEATNTGSVYVFKLENNVWVQKQKVQPGDVSASKYFGRAIALQNNQAIIGAYYDEIEGIRAGSAYIFEQIPTKE